MRMSSKCHYDNRNKNIICRSKICMLIHCAIRVVQNLQKKKPSLWYDTGLTV